MKLLFPYNQAKELQGLNNSGVETFMDSPYSGMARELGQNSIDVRSGDEPVIMHFNKLELPVDDIPNLSDFKRVTDLCLQTSTERDNFKEISFFKKAKALLEQETVSVLEVSDFNTKGASEKGFQALTGEGETEKDSVDSGGSFGIGKSAGFAVSDLRTVFYSTRHSEGDRAQGKTLYRSHQDENYAGESSRQSKGYWGKDYGPLLDTNDIPAWMRRSKVGTSVFALGMRPSIVEHGDDGWAFETLTVLAINFFGAIYNEVVQFHMDTPGKNLSLDRSTLKNLIENDLTLETAKKIALSSQLNRSRALFKCLSMPDAGVHITEITIPNAGKFKIRLLLEDGLGYKIGVLRNGIFITDNLKHFGHSFSRFPMYREFALVIEPADQETSARMKRLENPSHDSLTPSRIIDESERALIEAGFRLLGHKIRDFIKSHAKSEIADEQDLDEMNEFFNSDDEISDEDGDENSIKDIRITEIKVRTKPPKARRKKNAKKSSSTGGKGRGGNGDSDSPGGTSHGSETGNGKGIEDGDGDHDALVYRKAYIGDPRVLRGSTGTNSRIIKFTPDDSGEFRVSVNAEGIDEGVALPVAISGSGEYHPYVSVSGQKGDRVTVHLDLDEDYKGAVSVSCDIAESSREVS